MARGKSRGRSSVGLKQHLSALGLSSRQALWGSYRDRRETRDEVKMGYLRRALNSLKNDGPRGRPTRRRGEARGFRTVLGRSRQRNRPAGTSRARYCGLLDGVGRRPMRHGGLGGVTKALRPTVFAGCRLARGRSAPRRLPRGAWGPTLRETRSCAGDCSRKAF